MVGDLIERGGRGRGFWKLLYVGIYGRGCGFVGGKERKGGNMRSINFISLISPSSFPWVWIVLEEGRKMKQKGEKRALEKRSEILRGRIIALVVAVVVMA